MAKRDLWGLGAESWIVVARYAFAKIGGSFWSKAKLATTNYDSKDPVLPTLTYILLGYYISALFHLNYKDNKNVRTLRRRR